MPASTEYNFRAKRRIRSPRLNLYVNFVLSLELFMGWDIAVESEHVAYVRSIRPGWVAKIECR